MFNKKISKAVFFNNFIFFMLPTKNKRVANNKGMAKAL